MSALTEDDHTAATVVISHHVKIGMEPHYQQWLQQIIPIAKAHPGHLGVSVIHPVIGATSTYTIIIRYDTKANLIHWMQSAQRRKLIAEVQPLLVDDDQFEVKSGLDFWFTPEGAKAKLPTRWKQFLVTWSAIFPLVWLVSTLVNKIPLPDSTSLHPLKILTVTFVVVALMVYVVMPRYTKAVHKWLFT